MRSRRRLRVPVPPPDLNRARVNEKIRVPQVLLIDEAGEKIGIISTEEARAKAEAAGLDLVEVAAQARPPVCRVMDYGKFLFEQQKKDRAQKRKQADQESKEVRLRPGTAEGDLQLKVKHAREFLEEGHKVAIMLQFRGREQAHPEIAIQLIERFAKLVDDLGKIDQLPRKEGRRMHALIVPKKPQ